jgi:hypothetical protein
VLLPVRRPIDFRFYELPFARQQLAGTGTDGPHMRDAQTAFAPVPDRVLGVAAVEGGGIGDGGIRAPGRAGTAPRWPHLYTA